MSQENGRGKPNKTRVLRYALVTGIVVAYIAGVILNTGLGSPSAFGIGGIAAVCPVGILETALAGRIILPLPLIVFGAIAVVTVLFGRVFCGWACPIPLTRKLVTNKEERDLRKTLPKPAKNSTIGLGVLAAALVTTLIFGFPVFCLVCPVGLFFGTIMAVIRLVTYNELIIDLVVFPVLIVLELVLLRNWCSTLCPIGALLSLFGRFNEHLVPVVDEKTCLAKTHDAKCDLCHKACNYDIDLVNQEGSGQINDCCKCRECAENCPTNAITFPWKKKGGKRR